eukprot:Seg940.18 transcript_id=Seg940.18/GoldUCD/mRNA.D3Y31 product="hypothetical protein" protein_id=Seg940.18/GoldUCD/D3Y31
MPPIAKEKARVNTEKPKSISFVVENAIAICVANILILPRMITLKSDGLKHLVAMYPSNDAPVPRIECRVNQYRPTSSEEKFKGLCFIKSVIMISSPARVQISKNIARSTRPTDFPGVGK